jgi:hypothetical protein
MMEVAISLPDKIAQHLQAKHPDMPRYVLESIAAEGYRSRTLTTEEVRQLLGLEDRFAVHEFLAAHDVPFYTLDDLRDDLATLDRMQTQ